MERIRYTGPLAAVDLAVPGACLTFERMKWQDPGRLCEDASVPVEHLTIVLAGLGEDWEREGPVKAARTRKRAAESEPDPVPDEGDNDPAEPDEEQS